MHMYYKYQECIIKIYIPLLNLLTNCISTRSAPQIISIKGECTFLFLSFLIIGLCNSSANSLLEIFLLWIPLPEVFLLKLFYYYFIKKIYIQHTIYASLRWYPSYFGSLAILNALSGNTWILVM